MPLASENGGRSMAIGCCVGVSRLQSRHKLSTVPWEDRLTRGSIPSVAVTRQASGFSGRFPFMRPTELV